MDKKRDTTDPKNAKVEDKGLKALDDKMKKIIKQANSESVALKKILKALNGNNKSELLKAPKISNGKISKKLK